MIERVPEKHFKDVRPREVNAVHELHVFIVPSKAERAENGKIIEHKPLRAFYQVESFHPSLKPRIDEAKEEFMDDDLAWKHHAPVSEWNRGFVHTWRLSSVSTMQSDLFE